MRVHATVGAADPLNRDIRQRLIGVGTARHVVWQGRGPRRPHPQSDLVRARLLEGWLVVSIELETDQTGGGNSNSSTTSGTPQGRVAAPGAAVKINAATPEALGSPKSGGCGSAVGLVGRSARCGRGGGARGAEEQQPRQPLVVWALGRQGSTAPDRRRGALMANFIAALVQLGKLVGYSFEPTANAQYDEVGNRATGWFGNPIKKRASKPCPTSASGSARWLARRCGTVPRRRVGSSGDNNWEHRRDHRRLRHDLEYADLVTRSSSGSGAC